jgi:hypothetical protein
MGYKPLLESDTQMVMSSTKQGRITASAISPMEIITTKFSCKPKLYTKCKLFRSSFFTIKSNK